MLLGFRDSSYSPPLSPEAPIMEYDDKSLKRIHINDSWQPVLHVMASLGRTQDKSSTSKYNELLGWVGTAPIYNIRNGMVSYSSYYK